MITKTLLDAYVTHAALPEFAAWRRQPTTHPAEAQLTCAVVAVVQEAARLIPDVFPAHTLLKDISRQMPENLPQILAALVMNLSQRDRSILTETFGILERTRPSSRVVACCDHCGRNSAG